MKKTKGKINPDVRKKIQELRKKQAADAKVKKEKNELRLEVSRLAFKGFCASCGGKTKRISGGNGFIASLFNINTIWQCPDCGLKVELVEVDWDCNFYKVLNWGYIEP